VAAVRSWKVGASAEDLNYNGGGEEEQVFSFSESNLLKMFGLIIGASIVTVFFGVTAIGILMWGIVKRVRSYKEGEQVTPAVTGRPLC
jgi:hypothetical protein